MKHIWPSVWIAPTLLFVFSVGALGAEQTAGPGEEPSARGTSAELDRAAEHFKKGDYERARHEYEHATKEDPGSITAWRGLGWSLWNLGQKEQALKIWRDLLKVRPSEPELLLALGQAYEQQQQWSESLTYYDKLVDVKSRAREAHLGRARVFRALRKYPPAESEVQAALSIAPADLDAQFLLAGIYAETGRRQGAERLLRRLVDRQPGPQYLRALADLSTELGKFDDAVNDYRRALQMRPGDRGTIIGLFRVYAKSHRYPQAIQTLKEYLASNPGDDDVREQLARVAGLSGNYDEAERQWRTLMAKHPDDTKWQASLASLLHLEGQYDESVKLARQIVDREPNNTLALALLADDAIFSGREEEAIPWLQRLTAAEPNVARLDQLANIYLGLGDRLSDQGEKDEAQAKYAQAARVYEVGGKLDPTDGEAILGRVTALRLHGEPRRAIALAEEVRKKHPRLERATSELSQGYSEVGNFRHAAEFIADMQRQFPKHIRFDQERARVLFFGGDRGEAIDSALATLRRPITPNIPVLLYHGVTVSKRENAVPVEGFGDQMRALKREGYQAITVRDMANFLNGKDHLPQKPVLITFDDARSDSFRNADPVLRETGFKASMFIPVAEIDRHIAFYSDWNLIRQMAESGRWEMQCHGYDAHRKIPIDAEGHKGVFLVNRQWLEGEGRLETEDEFHARIDRDYQQCKESVEREVRGAQAIGYAFPFGDLGQKSLSNVPNAFEANEQILARHFVVAFIESPVGFVSGETPPLLLPRFEVPRSYDGTDLVRYLKSSEPRISTLFLLADFYSWSGEYEDADQVYDRLAQAGAPPAMLMERKSQVFLGRGDFAGARTLLETAAAQSGQTSGSTTRVYPENLRIDQALETVNDRVRPTLQFEGSGYSDNRDRSSSNLGPSGRVYLTDRWSLSSRYRYDQYTHDNFDLNDLQTQSTSSSGTTSSSGSGQTSSTPQGAVTSDGSQIPPQPARLRALGNEVEAQVDYQRDWSTGFSLSGGVAEFTNQSSPRVLGTPDTVPLASALASIGLSDAADVAFGGTHGYVGAAGAILDDIQFSASTERLRFRPTDWLTFAARHAFTYYDDKNRRNTGVGSVMTKIWDKPKVEVGYQFTYDDTLHSSPFFYTPDQLTAHEGVLSMRFSLARYLTAEAMVNAGVGKERSGNPEAQASATGNLEFQPTRHFGLFGGGGRSQSARFQSVQGSGGVFVKF